MKIDSHLEPTRLAGKIDRLWELSAAKIRAIDRRHVSSRGALVYTAGGRYTSRGWTEWTQGFQFGAAILQFDATGDERFLKIGRDATVRQSILGAKPAYELLGAAGRIGVNYARHGHAFTGEDWTAFLDFADTHLRGRAVDRRFDRFPTEAELDAAAAAGVR